MYSTRMNNCVVTFGQVPVGTTAIKQFPIKNNSQTTVTYLVTRSTCTNPIYQVFDVGKYEAKLRPGEEFILKITYSPNVPGSKNLDYFKVVDSLQNYWRLCFEGECIGPIINCSVRYLNFFQMPQNNVKKQTFLLKNISNVPATFQFDSNEEDESFFQVDTIRGSIGPHKHVYIVVNFLPKGPRLYSKQLWCLILHHEPVIVNLFGICSREKEDFSQVIFRYFPLPYEETVSFGGYMNDSVTIKQIPPPISLTTNHLDFGRIVPNSSCQTCTTSFTNHMESEVGIEWGKVASFRIYPEKLTVPGGKSALYECKFSPNEECRLFSATIAGLITWTLSNPENEETNDLNYINVPIPINLRLIGHSFPEKQSWIPSVSIIPNTVVLPLTLPNYASWTSFMIKSEGHLPVLFKLLPPGKTNFIIKPMVGLVRNYQIIIVQLQVTTSEPNSYIERWNIELNGRIDRLLPIYIKAQTELPYILIGNENVIEFEAIQPGTQTFLYLPVKNASSCHLQYEFKLPERLGIDPRTGELAPYEEIFSTCWYSSTLEEEGEITLVMVVQMRCIVAGNVIGPPYEIDIPVKIRCVYSELCSIPQSFNCGEVEYGTAIKTSFYLYNFGYSVINFKMCHDCDLQDLTLFPEYGRCGSKEKIMITVRLIVKKTGHQCIMIGYNNRVHESSQDLVSNASKTVFKIEYTGLNPVIQFSDLVDHNFGYLFDKKQLWDSLRIEEINLALREVVPGEIKRVTCYLPDCELGPKIFYIDFIIKNVSKIDTNIRLKRRQLCNCQQKESKEAISRRQKHFDCPHKEMLALEIYHPEILANSTQSLSLKIKYLIAADNVLSYFIDLTNNRTVIIDFFMYTIPPDNLILSIFTKDYAVNLGYIYIGLREAPVRAFWLYNNTSSPIPYKLDTLEMVKLCNDEGFPVLQCLNSVGFLKPRTRAPILFRFWPIEVKTYSTVVPLMLGMKMVEFLIEGCGTDQLSKLDASKLSINTKPVKNELISLSIDRVVFEPILVGSSSQRLFFIKNLNKTQVVKYRWRECYIDGLVKIEPLNSEGFLQPGESHSVVMKMISLSETCSVTLSLICEFYDETQFQHENSIIFNRDSQQMSEKLSDGPFSLAFIHMGEPLKLGRKPEYSYISIPVQVNVVGILDRDLCLTVEDQMKQRPFQGIQLDGVDAFVNDYCEEIKIKERPIHPPPEVNKSQSDKREKDVVINKEITQHVLECLVGDVVFGNYFREIVKILKTEPSPFYSQIKFDPLRREETRKEEIQKFLTQPETSQVLDICEEVVNRGIHTTFRLGPLFKNK